MSHGPDRRPQAAATLPGVTNEPTEAPALLVVPQHDAIAVFVANLEFGDHQRALIRLANKLHDFGYPVQVVSSGSGPLAATLRDGIGRIGLRSHNALHARCLALRAHPAAARDLFGPLVMSPRPPQALRLLAALAEYLSKASPAVMICASADLNVVAVLAKRLARASTGLILTERCVAHGRASYLRLLRRTYLEAGAIVAASTHVARSLSDALRIPKERVACVFDPAIPDDVQRLACAPSPHRWFDVDQPPVVVTAGDPGRSEDFALLLRAFARIRKELRVRLVLMLTDRAPGATESLRTLAAELRVAADFEVLGFSANPFAYLARAGVFASSATSERVGNLAAEALVCGCPVVSTRTQWAAELLDNGRYGRLVPSGDVGALADALSETLCAPRDSTQFAVRAGMYGEERTARAYEAMCREIGSNAESSGD